MSSILQSTLHLFAGWRSLLTPSGGAVLSPTAIALMGATGLYGGQQPKDDTAASDANILEETDVARPFRISHRGGRGQDPDRSVSVR